VIGHNDWVQVLASKLLFLTLVTFVHFKAIICLDQPIKLFLFSAFFLLASISYPSAASTINCLFFKVLPQTVTKMSVTIAH